MFIDGLYLTGTLDDSNCFLLIDSKIMFFCVNTRKFYSTFEVIESHKKIDKF